MLVSASCAWRISDNKAGINGAAGADARAENEINDAQAHSEPSDNNTREAEEGSQPPPPLQEERMLIPVVMWELKSLNAPKITPGFSVPFPLIHPAQQKVCSAAAADILVTLSLLRYHRKLKISVSTHTAFGPVLLFQGQRRWRDLIQTTKRGTCLL